MEDRLAVVSRRMVIHSPTAPTTHAPNRSSHRRTTRMGPPRARAVQATATTASHTPYPRWTTRFATRLMAQNSNPVHPMSCTMFSALGT